LAGKGEKEFENGSTGVRDGGDTGRIEWLRMVR